MFYYWIFGMIAYIAIGILWSYNKVWRKINLRVFDYMIFIDSNNSREDAFFAYNYMIQPVARKTYIYQAVCWFPTLAGQGMHVLYNKAGDLFC